MTKEVKKLVESLREDAEWARANEWETPITLGDNLTAAADMIEKLSADLETTCHQLEQVKQECEAKMIDLFNVSSKTTVKLAADRDTWKLRAKAAEWDIDHCCSTCQYHYVFFNGCTPDHDCTNPDGGCTNNCDRWHWRGPCAENGGERNADKG